MIQEIINYLLHFLGAFTIYCFLRKWLARRMSAKITMTIAVFWEIAQIDMWQSIYGINNLLNYYWIDTAIDLFLAALGIATVMLLKKLPTD